MKFRLHRMAPRLPSGVAEASGVRAREKVAAWGSTASPDGSVRYLVATERALYLPDGPERIPWHRISKATWDEPVLEARVLDESGQSTSVRRLRVDESYDLPAAVRDRVTDSVVVTERVDLGDGAAALMSARRDSDDGRIRWSVVFDAGLDPRDPELRARADTALADLRASLGI